MSEPQLDADLWQKAAIGAVGLWTTLLTWIGLKHVDKIERLELTKADGLLTSQHFDEVLARIDQHQIEDRDIHREISAKLDVVNDRLHQTNETLAGLVGELRGNGTL